MRNRTMSKAVLRVLWDKAVRMLSGRQTPAPEAFKLYFSDGAKITEDNLHKIKALEKLLNQSWQPASTPPSSETKRPLNLQHLALDPELPG